MSRWTRDKNEHLVKTAMMTDGELLHLHLGKSPNLLTEVDDQIYSSFQSVRSEVRKAALWVFGTGIFGLLSHFGFLTSVSASGMEVAPTIFSHAALLSFSISTMIFCFSYSKMTYLQAWFQHKYTVGESSLKARLLLAYPDAFWHFQFLRSAVGTPRFIFADGSIVGQVVSLVLVLLGLVIALVGSIALWIVVLVDVWQHSGLSSALTWFTLLLSVVAALLGWTSPFYYSSKRKYKHYGLVAALERLDTVKNKEAHNKIVLTAVKMGLVSLDE